MKKERGLKQLNTLFDRYRTRLVAPERVVLDEVVRVVDELLGITLTPTQLRYSPATRTVHITNGMVRAEVLPHQERILSHLKNRLGSRSAPTRIV
ncbi:MAG TPA: hypothetical protein VKP88_09070 [Candidatus Paceibacterota bacterium]|nr:hypothetical protein [Candidatus Paceibacterota bacterium]